MSEWVKVSDRLPEEGQEVLIMAGTRIYIGKMLDKEKDLWKDTGVVSAWMPLPSPPKSNF